MPRMYIISGCNGSGKTTASYALLPEMLNCREFVNSDEFAKSLSPFNPSAASVAASRYMIMKTKYLLGRDQDFCIETTLATRTLLNTIREARERGYIITLLYFWLNSPELAIKRVKNRVSAGGHDIADDVVYRRYYKGLQYFFYLYSGICDKWILADNSKPPFTIVAEGSGGMMFIKDNAKYRTIKELADKDD